MKNKSIPSVRKSALIASIILGTSHFIAGGVAATTWTNGTGNGLWNDAGNWDTNVIPTDYSSINIGNTLSGGTIDLGGGMSSMIDNLNFDINNTYVIANGTLQINTINSGFLLQEVSANVTSNYGYVRLGNNTGSLLISGAVIDQLGGSGVTDLWAAGRLTGTNTYTGRTIVNDCNTMEISGINGSILNTSLVLVEGANLILDNTKGNNDNRIAKTVPITLRFADLTYVGSNAEDSQQELGDITLKGGLNRIQGNAGTDVTDPNAWVNHSATLTINDLVRDMRATLEVNTQLNSDSPLTIKVTTAPSLVGGGGVTGFSQSILPWAVGRNGSLLTVDGVTGQLRELDISTEYNPNLNVADVQDNVIVSDAQNVDTARTINALLINYGQVHLASDVQLTVTSGTVSLVGGGTAISGEAGAKLHFDTAEGVIRLSSDTSIEVPIVGNNGLTVSGSGRLSLNTENPELSGPLNINGATVVSPVQGALGTGQIVIRGTGTHSPGGIAFDTVNQTFANEILLDTAMDTSPNSGSYSGANLDVAGGLTVIYSGGLSGRGDLNKTGSGKLIMTGHSQTREMFIIVSEGVLQFDGLMEAEKDSGGWFTSYIYGKMTGTGTIKGQLIPYGGVLAPGHENMPGILTASNLNVMYSGHLEFTLNGTAVGTEYSQLLLTSNYQDEYSMANLDSNSALLDLVLNFTPTFGDSFELINVLGTQSIVGTFKDLPEGSIYTAKYLGVDYGFQVSYVGGDGNDLVLTSVAVPEPALVGVMVVGAMGLMARRRR